jgi:hypothetical protein
VKNGTPNRAKTSLEDNQCEECIDKKKLFTPNRGIERFGRMLISRSDAVSGANVLLLSGFCINFKNARMAENAVGNTHSSAPVSISAKIVSP